MEMQRTYASQLTSICKITAMLEEAYNYLTAKKATVKKQLAIIMAVAGVGSACLAAMACTRGQTQNGKGCIH